MSRTKSFKYSNTSNTWTIIILTLKSSLYVLNLNIHNYTNHIKRSNICMYVYVLIITQRNYGYIPVQYKLNFKTATWR